MGRMIGWSLLFSVFSLISGLTVPAEGARRIEEWVIVLCVKDRHPPFAFGEMAYNKAVRVDSTETEVVTMGEVLLRERTRQFLEDPLLGEQDVDAKVCSLLEAEYLRRLRRYRRQDRLLVQKYGMTFEEFVEQRVVQQEGYTWDVEQDAMDWETAVGGMATMKRRLQELREAERV